MEASSAWVSFPILASEKSLGKRRSGADEDEKDSSGHGRKRGSRPSSESYAFKFSHIPPSLSGDSTTKGAQQDGVLHCEGRRERQWKVEFPSRKDPSRAHVFSTSLQQQSSTAGTQEVLLMWDEDSKSYRLERLAGCFDLQYDRGQSQRGLSERAKELLPASNGCQIQTKTMPLSAHQSAPASKGSASPSTQTQTTTKPKTQHVSIERSVSSPTRKPDMTSPPIEQQPQQHGESPRLSGPSTDWTPPEILDWDELEARREAQPSTQDANTIHSRNSSADWIQSRQQQHPVALGLDLNLDVQGPGAVKNKDFPQAAASKSCKAPDIMHPLPSTPGIQPSEMPFPEAKTDSSKPGTTAARSKLTSSWKPAAASDSTSHVEATKQHDWHDDDDESEEDSEEDEDSEEEEGEGDGNGADDLEDFARLLEEELAGEA